MIKELQQSRYFQTRCDGALSRTAIDLVLLDRLGKLEDHDAYHRLRLSAEVTITAKTEDVDGNRELIKGRAHWL